MSSGSCLTSKLYDKIIKMPSKFHEAIPLKSTIIQKIKCYKPKVNINTYKATLALQTVCRCHNAGLLYCCLINLMLVFIYSTIGQIFNYAKQKFGFL
jgi:hypothetical protein